MKPIPKNHSPIFKLDLHDPVHASLCLAMTPGLGPRTYQKLIQAIGSAKEVIQSAPSDLRRIPGVGSQLAKSIAESPKTVDIESELQRCDRHKLDIVSIDCESYPKPLVEIHDPPSLLYCRGDLLPRDNLAIAIVGTRHATPYGLRQAERLARGLAMCGFTIVSGLARGIDAAAHRGALNAGGRTLAVLGSGLLNIYPPEHAELSLEIAAGGAVLSEFPTLQSPKRGAFPRRNRIITGLSLGVIVVEAAERSGALISANQAADQNREVFAVPGPIDSRVSAGCHQLLRDGATLVRSIEDVIEQLGPLATATVDQEQGTILHPAELQLNEQESRVLQAISTDLTPIDVILAHTGLPVHRVLGTLSVLEVKHLIRRQSGSNYCRIG